MVGFESNIQLTIALIRNIINGEKLPSEVDFEGSFEKVMRLASAHELAHLVAYAFICGGLLESEEHISKAQEQLYKAQYRETKNEYMSDLAKELLTAGKIPFVPLKGSIIKNYYPEKWMRSSCDIDILVKKENFNDALKILENNGFTRNSNINFHDISLLYDDANLELHFSVCENLKGIDALLKDIWLNTEKVKDYEYREINNFFVFHHVAHMSYHFLRGGCGIRPFLDLWLLTSSGFFDEKEVEKLCATAKIRDFYIASLQLAKAWFGRSEHNDITKRMEKYTLTGGAYGYFPNNAAAHTIKNGGKIRYTLSLVFPPYANMKVLYPVLTQAKFLMPFCYLHRIFEKTFGKTSARAKGKYKIIKEQDDKFIKEVSELIEALNLDNK